MTCLCRHRKKAAVGYYSLETAGLEEDGLSVTRLGRFNPVKAPVPIAQEDGWASGPV